MWAPWWGSEMKQAMVRYMKLKKVNFGLFCVRRVQQNK